MSIRPISNLPVRSNCRSDSHEHNLDIMASDIRGSDSTRSNRKSERNMP